MRRESRTRLFSALMVGLLVLSACAQSAEIQSNTPRIESSDRSLETALITAHDARTVRGLGPLEKLPSSAAPVFEDPDPRAPCGTPVDMPDFSQGATTFLAGPGISVIEVVINLGFVEAKALLDSYIDDVRPNCPPYQTITNQGLTQTVGFEAIQLPDVAEQRLGGLLTFEVENQRFNGGLAQLRSGGHVAFLLVVSASPVIEETVQDLSLKMQAGLDRLPQDAR